MGAVVDADASLNDYRQRWTPATWLRDMERWVASHLQARGERVQRFDVHRIRIWSALTRIETDAGVRWAKEAHPGARSEMVVASLAERVAPAVVLPTIAIDHGAARIMSADATTIPADRATPVQRVELAAAAGRLQRALEPHVDRLVDGGLVDLRPARYLEHLEERLAAASRVPAAHALHVSTEDRTRVDATMPRIRSMLDVLADAPVAPTIDHNDLHPGNAFVVDGTIRIGDFGDALVAHPFASLRLLQRDAGVRDAYFAAWHDVADRATLERAADAAIALSGLHRFEAWWRVGADAPADAVEEFRPYIAPLLTTLGDVDAALAAP